MIEKRILYTGNNFMVTVTIIRIVVCSVVKPFFFSMTFKCQNKSPINY